MTTQGEVEGRVPRPGDPSTRARHPEGDTMKHTLSLDRDVQDKPTPTQQTWREVEPTGTARAHCSCGFDTGTVPTADAVRLGHAHLNDLRTAGTTE